MHSLWCQQQKMWKVFFSLLKVEKFIYFVYLSYHFLIIWLIAFYDLRLTMFFPCCQGPDLRPTFRLPPTSSEPLSWYMQHSALHETHCLRITYLDLGYMKYYVKSVIPNIWPEEKSIYWNSNSIHYHYAKGLCIPCCLRVKKKNPILLCGEFAHMFVNEKVLVCVCQYRFSVYVIEMLRSCSLTDLNNWEFQILKLYPTGDKQKTSQPKCGYACK